MLKLILQLLRSDFLFRRHGNVIVGLHSGVILGDYFQSTLVLSPEDRGPASMRKNKNLWIYLEARFDHDRASDWHSLPFFADYILV